MEKLKIERMNGMTEEELNKGCKVDIQLDIDKLNRIYDLEKELGIPLEVLFKALLRGILDEDGRHHSKVRLSNKLGYIGLVDEEGYCWDTKKYLSKWWILGGEYDD